MRSWVSRRRSSRIGSLRKVFSGKGLGIWWWVSGLGEVDEEMIVVVGMVRKELMVLGEVYY